MLIKGSVGSQKTGFLIRITDIFVSYIMVALTLIYWKKQIHCIYAWLLLLSYKYRILYYIVSEL